MIKFIIKIYTAFKIKVFNIKYSLSNISFSKNKWIHIGVWGMKNAGDTVLYIEVERLINKVAKSKIKFLKSDIHRTVYNQSTIDSFNRKAKAIVVGGGGLFLKDTNPNNISGWQWNIDVNSIRNIDIPLIIFAVGYNRFRKQENFEPVFFDNLKAICEKSVFIGLRNHGSLNAIKSVVDKKYHDRLFFQPCPTTVLNHIYPDQVASRPVRQQISINLAFDRKDLRFSSGIEKTIKEILEFKKQMEGNDCDVIFVGHCGTDKEILNYCNDIKYIDLTTGSAEYVKEFFRKSSITIGMRGHAQMIPYGLGMPILSLISHEKLKYFLDDIDHPEWGIEISDPNLAHVLTEKSNYILDHWDKVTGEIRESQKYLLDVSVKNIEHIQSKLQ